MAVKGVFGFLKSKTSNYLDERKAERDNESLRRQLEQKEDYRDLKRMNELSSREKIAEYNKAKSIQTINNHNLPLAKKLNALNELYKDHTKPKSNVSLQELSDKMNMNKYRKEQRLEKNRLMKQIIEQDKINQRQNRLIRMNQIQERNKMMKLNLEANKIIQREKMQLRRLK